MLSAIYRSHDTRIVGLKIDDAVGKIAPAQVHHINHVKIMVSQHGQNVSEHFGDVFIADRYPVPAISCHKGIRVIHRIADVSILQKIH